MLRNITYFLSFLVVTACSSAEEKNVYIDSGSNLPIRRCGTESFLNRYATFRCASLELEDNNQYVNKTTPIHNLKSVLSSQGQKLLVVDEKIFGARPRADQEIVCQRRLKVILNPGTGVGPNYQVGWITYQPNCLKFYNIRPVQGQQRVPRLFSRSMEEE